MADEATDRRRLGFWLRMARERANLSQPGAAKALQLSENSASSLSAWENGQRNPPLAKLRAMARIYEVPMSLFNDLRPTAYERIDDVVAGRETPVVAIPAEPGAPRQADADLVRRRRSYWLRSARNRLRMTRQEAARALEYPSSQQVVIGQWEDGTADPSDAQLRALAGVYRIDPEVLLNPPPSDQERLELWTAVPVEPTDERERRPERRRKTA